MSFPATYVEHDEEAPRSQAAASLRAREILLWYPTQSYKCKNFLSKKRYARAKKT